MFTMRDATVSRRVRRGMRLLDAVRPGWESGVNLAAIDVSSDESCVSGQVFGSYAKAKKRLNATHGAMRRHGFEAAALYRRGLLAQFESYRKLTEEWRSAVALRRADAVVVAAKEHAPVDYAG